MDRLVTLQNYIFNLLAADLSHIWPTLSASADTGTRTNTHAHTPLPQPHTNTSVNMAETHTASDATMVGPRQQPKMAISNRILCNMLARSGVATCASCGSSLLWKRLLKITRNKMSQYAMINQYYFNINTSSVRLP